MRYRRMPIEVESPEQLGYDTITNNLSESSVADRRLADLGLDLDLTPGGGLDDLLLCYGDHLGDPALRDAIAAGGDGLRADDVLVMPGAAAALFATATSVLEPGDHAVIVRTNYATNLETPRAIGADLDVVDLAYDDGWRLDVEALAKLVRPGETRLISVTCPHNPTGTMLDLAGLHALVDIAERADAVLLVDETYRDLTHGAPLPMAATLSPRVISVASMSKAYGLPGLRVGWAVCRDPERAEILLAAKEQMVICGATLDEAIAAAVLTARARILPPILDDVRARLAIVRAWIEGQDTFEWVEPAGGVVGFVRFAPAVRVDTGRFYATLLSEHGTYVGPGHWFEVDDRHFRLGYGWPTMPELHAGLAALSAAAADSDMKWGLEDDGELDRLLVISPHLDDVVISCGGLLLAHPGATVATLFAASPPAYTDPLNEHDTACGFQPGDDTMATRRAEDERALGAVGATPRWLSLCQNSHVARADPIAVPPGAVDEIVAAIRAVEPTCVVAPLGLSHVDHQACHASALAARERVGPVPWLWYSDLPYNFIPRVLGARFRALHKAGIAASPACPTVSHDFAAKWGAFNEYATQVPVLDGLWELRERLERAGEQYWELDRYDSN